jgi:hypothetical protein
MRTLPARLLGSILFGIVAWWKMGTIQDLHIVSLVHWPLLLPALVLEAVPATMAIAAAGALLFNRRSALTLLLLFAVTLGHAGAITLVAPEITVRYRDTVEQAESTWAPDNSLR